MCPENPEEPEWLWDLSLECRRQLAGLKENFTARLSALIRNLPLLPHVAFCGTCLQKTAQFTMYSDRIVCVDCVGRAGK
jgi:hypothetical protein